MGTDDADTVESFAAGLSELRIVAGEPSYQALAGRIGYGRSTVHEALTGRRLPPLKLTLAIVEALGGDTAHWRERWVAARTATSAPGDTNRHEDAASVPVNVPLRAQQTSSDAGQAGVTDDHQAHAASLQAGAAGTLPADRSDSGFPLPPLTRGTARRGRRRQMSLAGAAAVVVAVAVAVIVGLLAQARSSSGRTPAPSSQDPAPSACQIVARYRLTDDGNLLDATAGATIGRVREGDLVDLLNRADPEHPHRFLVVVERTAQIGSVDTAKLVPAGTGCIHITPAPTLPSKATAR